MVTKIILATTNPKKIGEIKSILIDLPVVWHELTEFPAIRDVEEDGKTFTENALIKARHVYHSTNITALADDSGLEIDALDGRPGVFSARYAGEHHNDKKNNEKVLTELQSVSDDKRTARFHCVVALVGKDAFGNYFEKTFDGLCEGTIIHAPRGTQGFGYDPIFLVPAYGKTYAELGPEIKNKISHRGRALEKFRQWMNHEE
jgi:XTP/dITP diphosphohydrolase